MGALGWWALSNDGRSRMLGARMLCPSGLLLGCGDRRLGLGALSDSVRSRRWPWWALTDGYGGRYRMVRGCSRMLSARMLGARTLGPVRWVLLSHMVALERSNVKAARGWGALGVSDRGLPQMLGRCWLC